MTKTIINKDNNIIQKKRVYLIVDSFCLSYVILIKNKKICKQNLTFVFS